MEIYQDHLHAVPTTDDYAAEREIALEDAIRITIFLEVSIVEVDQA